STITSTNTGTIAIKNLKMDGGASQLVSNGTFRFIIKTAQSGQTLAAISTQPTLIVQLKAGNILISEAMICNSASGARTGFVEWYNPNPGKINVKGLRWRLQDADDQAITNNVYTIFSSDYELP
ncbi:MAG TPA: hypothetical protein PLJ38_11965, partial [bacterium]|nr:hypothetical protein [bacterium]